MTDSDFWKIPGWECNDGTPNEEHDWVFVGGDRSVGEGDYMECRQCGKERAATDDERNNLWSPDDD